MNPTPWHFWPIVTIAFVWHLFGVMDYTAIQYDFRPWYNIMGDRQQSFVASMPNWVDGTWAVSAWVGLIGVVLMAFRAGFSPLVLSISMIATVILTVWLTIFADPSAPALAGWVPTLGLWIAALFTVLLWFYARDLHKHGVID